METGKTYTIVLDIIENTLINESGNTYYKFNIVSHKGEGISETKQGITGRKVHIGIQPTESTNAPYFEVINSCVGKFSFKNPMILEGDWSNKEIPQYFEGIKSVGEQEDGTGNINIKTSNKNLIDLNRIEIGS